MPSHTSLPHPLSSLLDATNCLHLKITPSLPDPPEILDHHVPIFTCTREDIVKTSWDLTIDQVGGALSWEEGGRDLSRGWNLRAIGMLLYR